MNSIARSKVLSLYKRILHLSKTWQAAEVTNTSKERQYIKSEAQKLFRQNSNLTDIKEIQQHVLEGEARLEMAMHYKNPYPRPINLPQTVLPPTSKKKMKGRQKILETSKPVHVKSYKTE